MLEYCTESPLLALYNGTSQLLEAYVGHSNVPIALLLQKAVRISHLLVLCNILPYIPRQIQPNAVPPLIRLRSYSVASQLEAELGADYTTLRLKLLHFLHDVHLGLRNVCYAMRPGVQSSPFRSQFSHSDSSLYSLFAEIAFVTRHYSNRPLGKLALNIQQLCVYCFPS
jgi:hypothetical protein